MGCLINFLFVFFVLFTFNWANFLFFCVSLVLFLRVRMFYPIVFCVICLSWIGLFVHLLLIFKNTGRVRVNSWFIFQVSSRTCVTSQSTGELRQNTHLKRKTGHRVQAELQPHFSPQAVGGLFSCPCAYKTKNVVFCLVCTCVCVFFLFLFFFSFSFVVWPFVHTLKNSVFSDLRKSFGKRFSENSAFLLRKQVFYWLVPFVWTHFVCNV